MNSIVVSYSYAGKDKRDKGPEKISLSQMKISGLHEGKERLIYIEYKYHGNEFRNQDRRI